MSMIPNDPTGLGRAMEGAAKLADSKLANEAYQDGLQPSVREGGKALLDITKAFRLFLAPFQFAALAQDRLSGFIERVRNAVPVEQQIEAAVSIAGPVMQSLVFVEDDNPRLELFLELLKRAIDKERINEAHPAFPRIIDQLSPDEALILLIFSKCESLAVRETDTNTVSKGEIPTLLLAYPEQFTIYLDHLVSLDLLRVFTDTYDPPTALYLADLIIHSSPQFARLSLFGQLFAKACIPNAFHHFTEALDKAGVPRESYLDHKDMKEFYSHKPQTDRKAELDKDQRRQ